MFEKLLFHIISTFNISSRSKDKKSGSLDKHGRKRPTSSPDRSHKDKKRRRQMSSSEESIIPGIVTGGGGRGGGILNR